MFKKQYSKFSWVCSLLLFQMLCVTAIAQNKSNETNTYMLKLWGHVRDGFTKASIPNVKITLMNEDSVVLDSTITFDVTNGNGIYDATYNFNVPAVPSKFIIKASHKDYEDCFVNFDMKYVKRHSYFDAKWHIMKRIARQESSMDRELNEVVVKASKVRFVYHGDTLVYNANAFNVPEGSMLDGLLKQMDGVEVDKDGNITVNGRHVDYLTLNGKDFFKGKNQVMLNNLPYYTVQKVEFFNKSTERSEVVGFDLDQRDFVGNVQLKREYSIGYMGNVEVGGGMASQGNLDGNTDITPDRYLARGFGIRFTGNTRLTLMGGLNNVGKSNSVDGSGNWEDYKNTSRMSSKGVGANLMVNGQGGNITNETFCWVNDNHRNTQQRTFKENYLLENHTFEQDYNTTDSKENTYSLENTFKINKPQAVIPFYFRSNINMYKVKSSSSTYDHAMMFGANPWEDGVIDADTINQQLSSNIAHTDVFQLNIKNDATVKLPWGDHADMQLFGNYVKNDDDAYRLKQYRFWKQSSNNSDENRYDDIPSTNAWGGLFLDYSFDWLSGWRLEVAGTYRKDYRSNDYDYYRLDRLGGKYADFDPQNISSVLPSNRDSLLMCRDLDLSKKFVYNQDWLQNYLKWAYTRNKDGNYVYFEISQSNVYYHRHMDYRSATQNYNAYKDYFCFHTNMKYEIGRDNMRRHFYIQAQMQESMPDETDILDITDRTDPMVIRKGNPDLKKSTVYKMS